MIDYLIEGGEIYLIMNYLNSASSMIVKSHKHSPLIYRDLMVMSDESMFLEKIKPQQLNKKSKGHGPVCGTFKKMEKKHVNSGRLFRAYTP